MNIRRCLRTAERIQLHFAEQVGINIDAARMLTDMAYADDVLVVCDAHPGTVLSALAQHYRVAASEPMDAADGHSVQPDSQQANWAADSSSFGATRTQPSTFDQERQAARAARRAPGWMTPGRWLGSDT